MSNPRNNGSVIGRLANDPKVFENSDGSKKVLFTVFADRNFTNAQGERQSDGIPVEAFIRKDVSYPATPFASIHKGDLVAVSTSLRLDRYTKNGAEVFELKVVVEDVTFLESRTVTQGRLAERVAAAEAENKAVQAAPVAQPAAVPALAGAVDEQLPF